MLKNKIKKNFLKLESKIKSIDALDKYIEYCIKNNTKERILNKEGVSKTSYHHILPKSLFPEYSNLKEHPWNGIHLLYSKHYIAHYLLTEAIDDYKQLFAFCSMHNKDLKLQRIKVKDLIPEEDFQKKMEERSLKYKKWFENNSDKVYIKCRKQSQTMKTKIIYNNEYKSPAEIGALKRIKRQRRTIINGKNLIDIRIQKTVKTRKERGWNTSKHQKAMKRIESNGKTKQENTTQKMLETQKNTFVTYKGKEISIFDLRRINAISKQREKCKKYSLYCNNTLYLKNLLRKDISAIFPPLWNTSKEKPLGSTPHSRTKLKKLHMNSLLGFYIEKE